MSQKPYIAILGAGESGVGAACLAKKQGYEVFVSDFGTIAPAYKQELMELAIAFEENQHSEDKILAASEVIKSPGIPDKASIIQKLVEKQIPILSEIEFAARYTTAKLIAITGSNGKSTTTMLTYHILKNAGVNVGLGGNIGQSFARQVANQEVDYYVLEISSFMLDNMYDFKADIAVLLNITPDHLDRYEYKMENYVNSKFRIIQNQTESDVFVYCADDPETLRGLDRMQPRAKAYPFSIEKVQEPGAYLQEDRIKINLQQAKQTPFDMLMTDLALQGKHNLYNSMASGINDSKATNVNSTWYALESMPTDVVLILGGVDKGNDYHMLKDLVKAKVKAIVCLGKDNSRIHDAFEDDVEVIVNTFSASEAAQVAYHLAKKGDTVLLSPACASFDLFKNYEDRGNQFKKAVKEL